MVKVRCPRMLINQRDEILTEYSGKHKGQKDRSKCTYKIPKAITQWQV